MKLTKSAIKYVTVIMISLVSLFPFYVLIYLSLNGTARTMPNPSLLLPDFHFANYTQAWKTSKMGFAMINSVIITAGSIALVVLLSSAAGYSIARFQNKFNTAILNIFLACLTIPAIIITVPLYSLMRTIGGINSYWAMILLMTCNALPFSVFMYTGFIKMLPREIEESAVIDGCTHFSAFWKVTFYFLRPVTSAVVILSGLSIWNNYGQAVFFLQNKSMYTIPLAVGLFFQTYGAQWNLMAAAAAIGLAPPVMVFLIFQKYFIKGITAGAVKG